MRIRNHAAFRLWKYDDAQSTERKKEMATEPEELAAKLSPSERATRVLQECANMTTDSHDALGTHEMFGLTPWEINFVRSNADSTWPNFTPKQEACMQKIEAKVFGE